MAIAKRDRVFTKGGALHRRVVEALLWAALVLAAASYPACNGGGGANPDGGDSDGETSDDVVDVPEAGDADDASGPCTPEEDEDQDGISDADEGSGDTDGDTVPDARDDDSDGDGYLDEDEAGDGDCRTPPVDTDSDGTPDFQDVDSDGDGVLDADERVGGTDPLAFDSDDDGWDDLMEVTHPEADPLDAGIGIPDDDWAGTLIPGGVIESWDLEFDRTIELVDVFLLVDNTGSMSAEIDTIKSTLGTEIIPTVRGRLPDTAFGVGYFGDFPMDPYGSAGVDVAFELLQEMTVDDALAQSAVERISLGFGNDWAESQTEALYQTATGEGLGTWIPAYGDAECIGAPCFRPGALPVILLFTDAPFHNGPPGTVGENYAGITPTPHTWDQAIAALGDIGASVIGLSSAPSPDDTRDLTATVEATGTVGADGEPLVYDIGVDGAGLTTGVVDGIEAATTNMAADLDTIVRGDPAEPLGVDTACFVRRVAPSTWFGPTGTEGDPAAVDTMDASTFYGVMPGARVVFSAMLRNEDCFAGDGLRRAFLATIVVRANGSAEIAERTVLVVVPAR
jgi:hypothetical protein